MNILSPQPTLSQITPPSDNSAAYLASYTRQIPHVHLLDFLRAAPPHSQRIYWQHQQVPLAFAGYGIAAEIFTNDQDRFNTINREHRALFQDAHIETPDPAILPRLFGGFAYHATPSTSDIWRGFPSAYFMLPRYLLTQKDDQSWLTISGYVASDAEAEQLRDELEHYTLTATPNASTPNHAVDLRYPLERPTWKQQITDATTRIKAGELDKVVLSRACEVTFEQPIDPLAALDRLQGRYPDTYRFLIEPRPNSAFFGATPELLASVNGRTLTTAALAGSVQRGNTPQEDDQYAQALLHNRKDRHEHHLVVLDIQQQLETIAQQLIVAATPSVLKLSNIQHLYTPISGELHDNYNVLQVIERLHPTPAMGGYPRGVADAVLRTIETISRGWYAAPIGWLDAAGNGMFAVAIRSAVTQGHQARLYAGVGIVADSDPDLEWDETQLKFRPMLHALGTQ